MTDERETIRLTYAGRRLPAKPTDTKALHLWVTDDGDERIYTVGAAIGGIYTFQSPVGETSIYPATKEWTGEQHHDIEQIATWQLEDSATMTTLGRRAAERRLAKSSDLDQALEPLLGLVRRLRTRHDVYAVTAYVSERIVEAYWKDR